MRHTVRLILGFGIIVILVLVVSLLRPRRIRTPFAVLLVAEYKSPVIPPNALAYEDIYWFSKLWANKDEKGNWTRRDIGFWGDPQKRRPGKETYVSQLMNNELGDKEFRPGGPDKDIVLVYVSAHGVTNSKNDPCLLMSDSDPYDESSWLPVKDLLKDIRTALGKNRQRTKVVVFLDASRLGCQLRFGLFYNAFNDQLKKHVASIADPNLVVINSARGAEVAWTAPEQAGSIFGRFVAQGLSGFASDDDVVTLGELEDYLRDKVPTWTHAQRAATQTPCVITTCTNYRNWKLARTSDTSRNAARDGNAQPEQFKEFKASIAKQFKASIKKRNDKLAELWVEYDRIANRNKATSAPLALADLHFQLSRLEQLVLAGGAYARAFDTSATRAAKLLDQLKSPRTQPAHAALSLPLVPHDQVSRGQIEAFGAQWKATPTAKQWKKADVAFSRTVVEEVIFQWLADPPRPISHAQLDDAVEMFDKSLPERTPDLVEANFLRMLKANIDRSAVPTRSKLLQHAITARRVAEQAAAPNDDRVHYWIRARCDLADDERRLAQDQLFVGSPAALQQAERTWTQLIAPDNGAYSLALTEAKQLSDAYRVRDMCWACLPDLARWLAVKARYWPDDVTVEYWRKLASIVSRTHELSAMLDDRFASNSTGTTDPTAAAERLTLRAQRIAKISALVVGIRADIRQQDRFFKDYNDCWDAQHERKDKTVIGRWRAMLQVPLTGFRDDADFAGVNGDKRNQRRDAYLQRLLRPDDDTNPSDKTRRVGTGRDNHRLSEDGAAESSVVNRLVQCPGLVLAILSRDDLADATKTPLTMVEPEGNAPEQTRDFLAALSGQIRPLLYPKSIAEESQRLIDLRDNSKEPRHRRFHLAEADRLLRAAAAVTGPIHYDFRHAPAAKLRTMDHGYFLLWHAQRALLDLWNDDGNRYYERAFQAYADAAEQTGVTSRPRYEFGNISLTDLESRLRDSLDEQQLANPRIAPNTQCKEEGDYLTFAVSAGPISDLPDARSFFLVRKSGKDPADSTLPLSTSKQSISETRPGTHRVGLPIGRQLGDATRVTVWVKKTRIGDDDELTLSGFFRGRTLATTFRVPNAQLGETFTVGPITPQKPSVEVHSNPQDVAIMFVLDYSRSMDTPDQRYKKAKDALIKVLERLRSDQSDLQGKSIFRVGLLVFSHRVGFSGKSDPLLDFSPAWQKLHPGEIPKTLDTDRPATGNTDLEVVLSLQDPLSLLSTRTIERIRRESETWKPLGNTPFYYAMGTALKEFQNLGLAAQSKHLVFVTDGSNELPTPRGHTLPKWLADFDERDVAKVIESGCRDVHIHVIGVGDDAKFNINVIRSASNYDVDFIEHIGASELLLTIERSIGISDFLVQDEERLRPEYRARVGRPCVIKDHTWRHPAVYDVSMPDLQHPPRKTRLFVEGGNEAFVLWRTEDGRRLVHHRFQPDTRYPTPAAAHDAFVSLLRPVRHGDGVTFPVTIQNSDPEKFSPRPVGVWAEIQPTLAKDGANVGHPYHLYDLVFEDGQPVPVLDFTIPEWPQQAFGAKVRFWYRVAHDVDEAARGIRDINVEQRDLSSPEANTGITMEKFSGVTITARRVLVKRGVIQVIVDERYQDAPPDISQFRIMTSPPAKQIERSYNHQRGYAHHVFTFYPDMPPRKLLVAPRSRIWEEYSHLDQQPVSLKLTDD